MWRAPSVEMERGQVQLMFDGLPAAVGSIKAGKLKLQAITGKGRRPTFPDVQTFTEAGLTDYGPLAWQGLFAPAGTPRAIIEKLGAGMGQVGRAADLAGKWRPYGGEPVGDTPEQFAAQMKAEFEVYRRVVIEQKLSLD